MSKLTNAFAGYDDPPSFDLGIEYQTQGKYMEAKKKCVEEQHGVVPATETSMMEIPLQKEGAGADYSQVSPAFGALVRTSGSVKRKSDELTWTSPDQRFKSVNTSPASMSKLLADGAVFTRMLRSEEGLDMNIQPWDHDTTDSPVMNKTVVSDRLAKSPWFHGLKHKLCPSESANGIMEKLMSEMGQSQLERYLMLLFSIAFHSYNPYPLH
jgi:hypothetical protein